MLENDQSISLDLYGLLAQISLCYAFPERLDHAFRNLLLQTCSYKWQSCNADKYQQEALAQFDQLQIDPRVYHLGQNQ